MGDTTAHNGLGLAVVATSMILLAGCGGSASTSSTQKFTQTWPTSYAKTTCQQWLGKLTPDQKFAAAADMLVGARSTDDKNAGLPSDGLINSFSADIDQGCEPIASMTITDAATSIYLLGRSQYQP